MKDAPQRVGHQGKNAMLANGRELYWIFGANQIASTRFLELIKRIS